MATHSTYGSTNKLSTDNANELSRIRETRTHSENRIKTNQFNIPPVMKTAYFYHDGKLADQGIRLVIHPNRYKSLEALIGDLSNKMPRTECGIRAIYTPKGINKVHSVADLQNNGHYICSERTIKPRVVSLERRNPINSSGRNIYGFTVNNYNRTTFSPPGMIHNQVNDASSIHNKLKMGSSNSTLDSNMTAVINQSLNPLTLPPIDTVLIDNSDDGSWKQLKQTKRIYVRLNGQIKPRKPVLIRRRYVRTLDQVLQELSELFHVPIHKIYTPDGNLVSTVDA